MTGQRAGKSLRGSKRVRGMGTRSTEIITEHPAWIARGTYGVPRRRCCASETAESAECLPGSRKKETKACGALKGP